MELVSGSLVSGQSTETSAQVTVNTAFQFSQLTCNVTSNSITNASTINPQLLLPLVLMVVMMVMTTGSASAHVKATNEGSYTYGYWQGSLTGPTLQHFVEDVAGSNIDCKC